MSYLNTHSKNVEELEKVLDVSVSLFEDTSLDLKEAPYFVMMGLFASVIEHCQSLLLMLKNNQFSVTQPISRCILEYYVDIKNVEQGNNYVSYLMSEYYNRKKENTDKRSEKNKYRKLRDKFYENYRPSEKFKCLTISEKFKLASLKEVYKSIYNPLSGTTHSGVFSLMNRTIESGENNKLSGQKLFKTTPSDMEINIIPLVTYYLLDSCEIIAKGHGDVPLAMIQLFKKRLVES